MTVSGPKGGADNGKHAVGHGAFFKANRLSEDKVMGLMKPQQISIRKTSMKTTKFSASGHLLVSVPFNEEMNPK